LRCNLKWPTADLEKFAHEAQRKVTPGEITEYSIEILATANLFRRGHRICVEARRLSGVLLPRPGRCSVSCTPDN